MVIKRERRDFVTSITFTYSAKSPLLHYLAALLTGCYLPLPPPKWLTCTLPLTLPVLTIAILTTTIQLLPFILLSNSPLNIHLLVQVQMKIMILLQVLQSLLLINQSLNQNHKLPFLQNFTRMSFSSSTYFSALLIPLSQSP